VKLRCQSLAFERTPRRRYHGRPLRQRQRYRRRRRLPRQPPGVLLSPAPNCWSTAALPP